MSPPGGPHIIRHTLHARCQGCTIPFLRSAYTLPDLGGAATMRQSGDSDICRARYRNQYSQNRPSKPMASFDASQSIAFTGQTARFSCNQAPSTHQTRMSSSIHSHTELSNNFANLGSRPGVQASLVTISFACTLGFSVLLSGVSSPPLPIFQPFASFSCFTRIPPLLCSIPSPPSTGTLTHSH